MAAATSSRYDPLGPVTLGGYPGAPGAARVGVTREVPCVACGCPVLRSDAVPAEAQSLCLPCMQRLAPDVPFYVTPQVLAIVKEHWEGEPANVDELVGNLEGLTVRTMPEWMLRRVAGHRPDRRYRREFTRRWARRKRG